MSWPHVGPKTDVGKSHQRIKQNTNKIHWHFQQSQTLSSSIQSPYRLQCFYLLKAKLWVRNHTLYLHYLVILNYFIHHCVAADPSVNCEQYLSVFNVFFRIVTHCVHFILDYSFNPISAGEGGGIHPPRGFPSPSAEMSTDQVQTFGLLNFTIQT